MRIRLCFAVLIVFVFALFGFLTRPAIDAATLSGCRYEEVIRLHVLANSNAPDDQSLKLRVRDAILHDYGPLFCGAEDRETAERLLCASLGRIEQTARREISLSGKDYGVHAEYGSFDFPERTYSFATLPAGRYRALRVTLGKAEGTNWWCVLYPPLCFVSEQDDALLREEIERNGGRIEWHFGLLEGLLKKKGLVANWFWKSWAAFFGLNPTPAGAAAAPTPGAPVP